VNPTHAPFSHEMSGRLGPVAALVMIIFSATVQSQEPQKSAEPPPAKPAMATQRPMISTGIGDEAIARNHPDSTVWLTNADQDRTLALFQPEQSLPARGALVILADEGVSAASGGVDALRAPLSRAGWAVMTLGLPAPPFAVQQWLRQQSRAGPDFAAKPSGKSADPQGQQASEEPSSVMIDVMGSVTPEKALNQYRNQVMASLNAAVDDLQERQYQRIALAGVGRAAGHITRQAGQDNRTSDLVWIAPHFYTDESAGLTEMLASVTSLSVLELYSTFPGTDGPDRAIHEREAAMTRAGLTGYEQQPVAMDRQPRAREAHKLSNRISAWLSWERKRD